jgi:hypothetical protein
MGSSAADASNPTVVASPEYRIVLQRGIQEGLDAVDSASFAEVNAAIASLGGRPRPADSRPRDRNVDGPYSMNVAGYRITWMVSDHMRNVLVQAIFKPAE